ncbi:hypothetical protein ID866_8945 [Astraeus odoratus]|nr:hypothetical protein ID866_8945 [Astraeus odoratus]
MMPQAELNLTFRTRLPVYQDNKTYVATAELGPIYRPYEPRSCTRCRGYTGVLGMIA